MSGTISGDARAIAAGVRQEYGIIAYAVEQARLRIVRYLIKGDHADLVDAEQILASVHQRITP